MHCTAQAYLRRFLLGLDKPSSRQSEFSTSSNRSILQETQDRVLTAGARASSGRVQGVDTYAATASASDREPRRASTHKDGTNTSDFDGDTNTGRRGRTSRTGTHDSNSGRRRHPSKTRNLEPTGNHSHSKADETSSSRSSRQISNRNDAYASEEEKSAQKYSSEKQTTIYELEAASEQRRASSEQTSSPLVSAWRRVSRPARHLAHRISRQATTTTENCLYSQLSPAPTDRRTEGHSDASGSGGSSSPGMSTVLYCTVL